ncbi:uncharacterized protein LOC108468539 [Gossypium arboreum]|uniref:uncharacterized protein LOC108468539 n=1 Tax=Gossypium arboreum TaxID=29729 RepID=UPI00081902D2|nr:uncharacterized protein LOC108468539 [Gossypium arboreum]
MTKNDALIQSQKATLKNLENQMGQLAVELHNRSQGALPSDIENISNLGKEHYKVVDLRSGKTLEPKEVVIEDERIEKEGSQPTVEIPTPVELELTKSDEETRGAIQEVFGRSKATSHQHPLVEALEKMPNYVKFMKDILSKKKRLNEYETVALMKECSAFIQNKLLPKLKDLGSFTIFCNIRES